MMTIQEFIAEQGITLTAQAVPENPNMEDKDSDWFKHAAHFHCTFIKGEKSFSMYYSAGIGNVISWGLSKDAPHDVSHKLRSAKVNQMSSTRRTVYQDQALQFAKSKYKPDGADVLDCLAMDADVYNYRSFEDWAECMGYDTDSRSAERTFNLCKAQARQMEYMLGAESFRVLVEEIERM